MKPHEKSVGEILLFCPSKSCKVISFIQSDTCPSCKELGIEIRQPVRVSTSHMRPWT